MVDMGDDGEIADVVEFMRAHDRQIAGEAGERKGEAEKTLAGKPKASPRRHCIFPYGRKRVGVRRLFTMRAHYGRHSTQGQSAAGMNSNRKLWALWFFLVFGLFNIYGPPLQSYKRADDPAGVSAQQIAQRLTALQFIGVLARNDIDTARYFAYANAMLGRPYSSFFVRKMEDWRVPASSEQGRGHPIVTPARPLWPWRDFSMEYPPGMAIFALGPALLTDDLATYHFLFGLEMEVMLSLAVFAAVRSTEKLSPGQGARTLGYAIGVTAAIGSLAARRYDACVSLSLGLTLLGLATRRPARAGLALAFGVVARARRFSSPRSARSITLARVAGATFSQAPPRRPSSASVARGSICCWRASIGANPLPITPRAPCRSRARFPPC